MEKLSDKNPCNNCNVDRQIGNPYRWQCECDSCMKPSRWKDECVKKLKEYEDLEEQGKLLKHLYSAKEIEDAIVGNCKSCIKKIQIQRNV